MTATAILLVAIAAPVPIRPAAEPPRPDDPRSRAVAEEGAGAIGVESLPALAEAARNADDPADRDRALARWREATRAAMHRPTLVPPDLLGRSMEQVTEFIDRLPESGRGEAGAIPFWEAVERLCDENGWTPIVSYITTPGGLLTPVLRFNQQPPRARVATSGPFRVAVDRLTHRRERRLIDGPWVDVDGFAQRLDVPGNAEAGPIAERFDIALEIMSEPRLLFVQIAPAFAIEAVDDLGQSLALPEGQSVPYDTYIRYRGAIRHQAMLPLAYPGRPGSRIDRLKGAIPVLLEAREPVPALVVPLADAEGRVVSHGGVTIEVAVANVGESTSRVTLDVRVDPGPDDLHGFDPFDVRLAWLADLTHHQFELVNADGVARSGEGSGSWGPDGRGRISLSTRPDAGTGPATELRYYPMLREPAEIAFEFADLPMP